MYPDWEFAYKYMMPDYQTQTFDGRRIPASIKRWSQGCVEKEAFK